jgi:hypothetical protein
MGLPIHMTHTYYIDMMHDRASEVGTYSEINRCMTSQGHNPNAITMTIGEAINTDGKQ